MVSCSQPLVSVVTPAYNEARHIAECIESVLAQTYTNWDYTIVNNCSTDRTLDIAQEYASRDPRIRIHSNETFVRVIANHNVAFRQISPESKYCKPLAADDMLLPECLEKMVGLAEEHPNVGIVGAYGLYSRADMGVYCKGVPYSTSVLPGRELCRSYLLRDGPSVFGSCTFTLFRSDLVRSHYAFYNESNIHADSEACLEFLEQHDFGFVHQILTLMRVQDNTLGALSARLNTPLPHRLYALTKYGPIYLKEDEMKKQIQKCLREYYNYLGAQFTRRRNRGFWNFHRGKLAELGYPLSTARLAAHTATYALELLLNPKSTVEKARRHFRQILSVS